MRYIYFFILFFVTCILYADGLKRQVIPKVSITAHKKWTQSSTSGPVTVLAHSHLKNNGVISLYQALQGSNGITLHPIYGNESGVTLSMRGFGANATSNSLFVINGIPITNPDMSPIDLSIIPIDQIEQIEIISGSESVLYGDQAVGGVVNVIVNQKAINQGLSCSAGSYNLYGCYISLNKIHNQFHYGVVAKEQHTDNYREHNQFDQQLLLGYINYAYLLGNVRFNYYLAQNDMQYPGGLTSQQVGENRRQASNTSDFFKNNNVFLHFQHEHQFTDTVRALTDFAIRERVGHGALYSSFNQTLYPFTQSYSTYFLRPKIEMDHYKVKSKSGFEIQQEYYHFNSSLGDINNKQEKYAVFGLINISLTEKLIASFGARGAMQHHHLVSFSDTDSINRAFAETIGLTYSLTNDSSIYLRRAGSFRFPKADENAQAPVGVSSLRTQRGQSYESGMEIKKEKYSGKFEVYQLNLSDEIAYDPTATPEQPFGSNRNLDPTIRRGLSLSGKIKMTERLQWDGQYNYVDAKFQNGVNSGNRIPLVSENMIRSGIHYQMNEAWSAYAEGLFTGSQFADNDDANVSGKVGGYTIYNLNLRYVRKNWNLILHANNIFNKYYYFYVVSSSGSTGKTYYPAPDRNVMLTVKWDFN